MNRENIVDLNPTKDELASWIGTAVVCCDMQDVIAHALLKILHATDLTEMHDEVIALIGNMHKAHVVADEEFEKIVTP
jgi:hypothetical protein